MGETERYIHDAYIARGERTEKRLWILCIIIFLAFVISNCWWVYKDSQYVEEETTTIEATQDSEGVNIVSGGDALNVTDGSHY